MRYKILAPFLACMLLCGCNGGEDTSGTQLAATTESTTAETQTSKNEENIDVSTVKTDVKTTTAATSATTVKPVENASQEQSVSSTVHAEEVIVDFGAEATEASQAATTVETTQVETIPNGGDMADDGLNWSALTPVE